MVIEFLLGVAIMFGLGSYVKSESINADKITEERQPDVWPPKYHEKLLRTCAIACGENNLKEYSIIYGKCKCKDK